MKIRPTFLRQLAALACGAGLAAAALAQPATHHFRSQPIANRYIVTFKQDVADPDGESDRIVRNLGGRKHHAFRKVLKGFSATLSDAALERLRNDPEVEMIEQDQTVSIDDVEDQPTWGLDRIDQADRPVDSQYHYNYTGAGVYAFIIDTGIRKDHTEFGGRAIGGFAGVGDGNGTSDCHGHGTHVAGTVGGATYGVAKQVTLIPVRVLGCNGSGSWSGVIAGIDWMAATNMRPAVANMSLGGTRSASINNAVAAAVQQGITMVVAAGNDNADACLKSPASAPTAITVGATTSADARASFSNFGTCVDVFAPGVGITSAWNTSSTATNTISGTSMATPHVTGIAALALSAKMDASPAAVAKFIVDNATPDRISSANTGSPNRLAYSLGAGVPTEPPPVVIAVSSLNANAIRSGRSWRGSVSVSVRNLTNGGNVVGAVVTGQFAPGGTQTCTTSRAGSCSMRSDALPTSTNTTVLTITGVQAPGYVYDATQNSASQVTVNRR